MRRRRGTCQKPPRGWWCSMPAGHAFACPTRPTWWKATVLWIRGYPL